MGELAELLGGGLEAPPSVFMIVRKSIVTAPTSGPLRPREHFYREMHAIGDHDIQIKSQDVGEQKEGGGTMRDGQRGREKFSNCGIARIRELRGSSPL
jgi:hypothetical protein